jgi:hypothetical protein
MDDICDKMKQLKVNGISELVKNMRNNDKHWVLWKGDHAPFFRCGELDEVILELYWKHGSAIDIKKIRQTVDQWWARSSHDYVQVDGEIVGEVLCLFNCL